MELSEKYVYEVYEKKSFSAASRELFVSQPALSAMVARLEKEIGFKIFDRTTSPISLTPRGRIYIEYLEEIIQSEKNMHMRMRQFSDMDRGALSIGGFCHTAYFLLPIVCSEFYKRYPNIEVNLNLSNKRNFGSIMDAMKNHSLDLGMTYKYDPSEFEAEPLIEERLVVAVNRNMPCVREILDLSVSRDEVLLKNYSEDKEISDFSVFKNVIFLSFIKAGSTVNRLMDRFEGNYKLSNYCVKNSEHLTMHYNMMFAGLGALIASDTHIRQPEFDTDDIVYFIPKCAEAYRTLHFLISPGCSENIIVKNFISLTKEACSKIRTDSMMSFAVNNFIEK